MSYGLGYFCVREAEESNSRRPICIPNDRGGNRTNSSCMHSDDLIKHFFHSKKKKRTYFDFNIFKKELKMYGLFLCIRQNPLAPQTHHV